MNTQNITQDQITEARDWASDCKGLVGETVSAERAIAYVKREYPGGWDAFVAEVCVDALVPAARNFRVARKAIQVHEVTDGMLTSARRDADKSWLAQTIWPSRWYGKDYLGHDCLVLNACAVGRKRPADADKDAEPLMTVLPTQYLSNQILALEDHKAGACGDYCPFEPWNRRLLSA